MVSADDAARALSALLPADHAAALAAHVARLPDAEGALILLNRLGAGGALPRDPVLLHAILTLGGCSPYLGGLLVERPDLVEVLSGGGPDRGLPTREDLEEDLARHQFRDSASDLSRVLQRFKQREYLRIALSDFLRSADLVAVTRTLALLADILLEKAVRSARAPLEARHGRPTFRNDRGEIEESGFVVIGLGKLGGEELNYSSDIDILYLFARDGETTGVGADGAGVVTNREFFTRLATEVTRIIGGSGPGGEVFRVDLNLRPGGRDGDIAISAGAAAAYYRGWAEPWERQALIKARPVAGDLALGRRFVAAVEPLVYPETPDPYLGVEIGAMKDRIDAQLSQQGHSERDVKLGRGGIRELEFAVQALQLQRGGRDPWLRHENTLLALHRLADRGLVGFAEYAALGEAYAFLRDVEHRLQLGQNRQTALLPAGTEAWGRLARSLWLPSPPRDDEGSALEQALERHRAMVRSFYDSVIGGASQLGIEEEASDLLLDRLDDAVLARRLRRLGLPEGGAALQPIHGLRRLLQPAHLDSDLSHALRRAGPLLLGAAVGAASPRRALANLELLFSSLIQDPEGLRRFLRHREILGPTVRLLGRSDLLAGILVRQPAILKTLEDRARMVHTASASEYRDHLLAAATAPGSARRRASEVRQRHQAALATIAFRDINRLATVREVVKSLSDLADAAVEAALALARAEVREAGAPGAEARLSVLGLGRLGYREIDYGSDLDLVFVHSPSGDEPAAERAAASRVCEAVVRLLSTLSRDGQLYRVDLRLRPSGSKGDLVASPSGLLAYMATGAEIWEMQSFLKARAVAGEEELGAQVIGAIDGAILARMATTPRPDLARAVRDMRRRLAAAGRQAPEARRPKLGPGGLADIDFVIEYLQLAHGLGNPRDKDTLRLLAHLASIGLLDDGTLRPLYEGYLFLRAVDHEMRLIHGAPMEALPTDPVRLREIATALPGVSEAADPAAALLEAWDRTTSAIRRAYDQVLPPPDEHAPA